MKIALCFYGLNRSLQLTYNSIFDKILNQFIMNNIDYDVYFHTFKTEEKLNPWTGAKEINNEVNNDIVKKYLKPIKFEIEDDKKIRKNISKIKIKKKKENFYISQILRGHSMQKVIGMINNKYDFIFLIRPDVYFLTYFNINWLNNLGEKNILIPDFHHWSGINDRFLVGKQDTITKLCTNYKKIFEKDNNYLKCSENFFKQIIKDYSCNIKFIKFYFVRIRSDYSLASPDEYELKENNKSEIISSEIDRFLLLDKNRIKKILIFPNKKNYLYFENYIINSIAENRYGTRWSSKIRKS